MKLYEYLKLVIDGVTINVFDNEYDTEMYFYGGKVDTDHTNCGKLLKDLSKKLTIEKIDYNGKVFVNLSDVIENNLDNLKKADLFTDYDIEYIMMNMEDMFANNINEDWLKDFIECLK